MTVLFSKFANTNSDIRLQVKWALRLVIADGHVIFPRCLCTYVLVNILTSSPTRVWHLIGNKFFQAHGAEILCSKCSGSNGKEDTDITNGNPTSLGSKADIRWQRFVSSLREKGYFRVSHDTFAFMLL